MLTKTDLNSIKKIVETIVDAKIEGLASMISISFGEIDRRFEQVDKRFEEMDNRFDRIEYKFAQRFDLVEDKLRLVSARVGI